MKLDNDIYVYEWTNMFENNCNSFFIGGSVQALIDPGLKVFLPDLLEKMKADGIDPKNMKYVLNTHSHPDHFEASETFDADTNIKIGLHKDGIDFLKGAGGHMYGLFGLDAPKVSIDMVLEEGPLKLGDEDFEILHVPGHSPGSIALYWPSRKALFPGDVIFNQNIGRTDFPGGNGELLKKSIRRLSELDTDWLFPGHMNIITGNEDVKRNFRFVIDRIFAYI
ncbi:MAG TPA: MBL fold metallo-hydrolase [Syntrophales bacterium]|nr:MBL fold metallo-hydrolase [Syntrophales bacterium]HPQ44348.1 MBL fold metallo-hydrolase [Syntrophales bacterium]